MSVVRSGALRAVALLGKARYGALPDLPTVGDFVPGYVVQSLSGFGARKATPWEIIERLNAEMNAGLATAAMNRRFDELSAVPWTVSPAEFDASMVAQTEKWAKVIRAANIKPE
jgi:tripartite-type tricarboxylate transporter receptor subunit TctC